MIYLVIDKQKLDLKEKNNSIFQKIQNTTTNEGEKKILNVTYLTFSSFQNMSYSWAKGVCNVTYAGPFHEICFTGQTFFVVVNIGEHFN